MNSIFTQWNSNFQNISPKLQLRILLIANVNREPFFINISKQVNAFNKANLSILSK